MAKSKKSWSLAIHITSSTFRPPICQSYQAMVHSHVLLKMAFAAGTVSTTLAAPLLATQPDSIVVVDTPESDTLLFESAAHPPPSFSDSNTKTEVDIVWQDDPRKFKQERGSQARVVPITVPVPEPVEVEDDFLVVEAESPPAGCQRSSETEVLSAPAIKAAFLPLLRPEVLASSSSRGFGSLRQRSRLNLFARSVSSGLASLQARAEGDRPSSATVQSLENEGAGMQRSNPEQTGSFVHQTQQSSSRESSHGRIMSSTDQTQARQSFTPPQSPQSPHHQQSSHVPPTRLHGDEEFMNESLDALEREIDSKARSASHIPESS
ncbi:hypothetical protein EV361DRAFT_911519 [Lentinula raphanica]|nr:hypothetical protein EV361DRAFT_911519 [Lentinula raphanica]